LSSAIITLATTEGEFFSQILHLERKGWLYLRALDNKHEEHKHEDF
jgi:hypothetical protein